jgi:hypothetical protein
MILLQIFTILFPGSLLYLLKCYPKSPQQKDVLKNWNFSAMGFVRSSDMWSLRRRISDAYVIAGSYFFSQEVENRVAKLNQPTVREGNY